MQNIIIARRYSVFPIGLGAMPLSIDGRPSADDASRIIATFLENGGNFIDTADVYGWDDHDRGHNEKLIQKVLKEYPAHDVVVATKGGATRPEGQWGFRGGGHPHKLRQACETSLRNLALPAHDLYYLHGPDPDVPLEDSLGELINLQKEGKIRHIGVANVQLDQLKLATQLTTIVAVQNRCNLFCKNDLHNGLMEFCKLHAITYVPYCPLGGWADHAKLANLSLFNHFTHKYGVSSYEISLAWLRNKSDIILPIPGMDKVQHIDSNFHSLSVQLEPADISKLDAFPDLYSPVHLDV